MILLNILCRYWYIYFNVTDKNIFFFFLEYELIRHACSVYPSLSLLSLYFSLTLVMLIWLPLGSRLQNWERALCKVFPQGGGRGWGEGTQQIFIRGGSAPSSNPLQLPFYVPFFTRKVPLSCTFYWQILWYPFHIPCLELCIPFNCCKCTVF